MKLLKKKKSLQKFLLIWAILQGLCLASSSQAADFIVFDSTEQVYTDLQNYRICEERSTLQEQKISELEAQTSNTEKEIEILKQEIELFKQKDEVVTRIVNSQDEAIKRMQTIVEMQKEGYEAVLKAQQPTFMDKVKDGFSFTTLGVVIGIVLMSL